QDALVAAKRKSPVDLGAGQIQVSVNEPTRQVEIALDLRRRKIDVSGNVGPISKVDQSVDREKRPAQVPGHLRALEIDMTTDVRAPEIHVAQLGSAGQQMASDARPIHVERIGYFRSADIDRAEHAGGYEADIGELGLVHQEIAFDLDRVHVESPGD